MSTFIKPPLRQEDDPLQNMSFEVDAVEPDFDLADAIDPIDIEPDIAHVEGEVVVKRCSTIWSCTGITRSGQHTRPQRTRHETT